MQVIGTLKSISKKGNGLAQVTERYRDIWIQAQFDTDVKKILSQTSLSTYPSRNLYVDFFIWKASENDKSEI